MPMAIKVDRFDYIDALDKSSNCLPKHTVYIVKLFSIVMYM